MRAVSHTGRFQGLLAGAVIASLRGFGPGLIRFSRHLVIALGWRGGAALCGVLLAATLAAFASASLTEPQRSSGDTTASPIAAANPPMEFAALRTNTNLEWVPLNRPVPHFALGMGDIEGQPVRLSARRDQASGLREDIIEAGQFAGDGALLHLTIRRASPPRDGSLFVVQSRHAADFNLSVARSAQPTALSSKFGQIEVADMMLAEGTSQRPCLSFRHSPDDAPFSFQGWLCGTTARAADRQQLTCLIDRLNLINAGDARALRTAFSKAELNRPSVCTPPKLQAAGRKVTWLDNDQPAPKLRRQGG